MFSMPLNQSPAPADSFAMGDRRHAEHRPVQTSAVFVLGKSKHNAAPPPSPPSPPQELCESVESLSISAADSLTLEANQRAATRLQTGLHVLTTEAQALRSVAHLYETDPIARDGFNRTVEAIIRHKNERGKVVITGVGKSGHIANKITATFNSLSVPTVFLNPLDALHGDLGVVSSDDTLILITFSGRTAELMSLVPHIERVSTLILLTGHARADTCEFTKLRPDTILLPAPVHESESASFGVSAPTTSTTVALAVGDAVAMAAAQELHPSIAQVFARNHPGGAIGATFRQEKSGTIKDLAVQWDSIPDVLDAQSVGSDLLRAGFDSPVRWVRGGNEVASPSRIRRLCSGAPGDLGRKIADVEGLLVPRHEMLSICAGTSVRRAVDFVRNVRGLTADDEEEGVCGPDSVLAILEKGEIVGVIEVGELLEGREL
ncbi:arabinose 5-phosphate isomerase [Plectosphaerella plurivora]|uniref:Arabinose 5-phosphate isomerase n=1 Tax=Plectosphaerella plurivora TaxID=936078 RepID=A0A9P8VHR4_9PEZI|nr:arabinose 5-phosphate isomerase [Plectosphaerella plurivora]